MTNPEECTAGIDQGATEALESDIGVTYSTGATAKELLANAHIVVTPSKDGSTFSFKYIYPSGEVVTAKDRASGQSREIKSTGVSWNNTLARACELKEKSAADPASLDGIVSSDTPQEDGTDGTNNYPSHDTVNEKEPTSTKADNAFNVSNDKNFYPDNIDSVTSKIAELISTEKYFSGIRQQIGVDSDSLDFSIYINSYGLSYDESGTTYDITITSLTGDARTTITLTY